jgi:hypothetical protein
MPLDKRQQVRVRADVVVRVGGDGRLRGRMIVYAGELGDGDDRLLLGGVAITRIAALARFARIATAHRGQRWFSAWLGNDLNLSK